MALNQSVLLVVYGTQTRDENGNKNKRFFVQTFFLARQTNPDGYYILNNVLRYLPTEFQLNNDSENDEELSLQNNNNNIVFEPVPDSGDVEDNQSNQKVNEENKVVESNNNANIVEQ